MDHLETTVDLQHLLLDPNNYRFQDEPKFLFADKKDSTSRVCKIAHSYEYAVRGFLT